MLYIAIILWILIWGAAGYLTVRAIKLRKESKRIAKLLAIMNAQSPTGTLVRITDINGNVSYTPFPMIYGVLKKGGPGVKTLGLILLSDAVMCTRN